MTVLVLSDIHANHDALEAVLQHAAGQYERVWFLGDCVGYGPEPNRCVERLQALAPEYWLAGNHDWAALGKLDLADFNPHARQAAEWTSQTLSPAVRDFLDTREPMVTDEALGVTLVHASPRHPIWEYILDAELAYHNFATFESRICFFGHTHLPIVYEEYVDGVARAGFPEGKATRPDEGDRWMVNPGSVGQPRDGDPRASYLLYDPEDSAVTLHRVSYDVAAVQAKIRANGLPDRLAARLAYGW